VCIDIRTAIHFLTSDPLQHIQFHKILLGHDSDDPFYLPHPPTEDVVLLWGKKKNRKTDNRRSLNSLTVEANQSSDTISKVKSHRSTPRGMKTVNIYSSYYPFIFGFCLIFFPHCLYPYIPTPFSRTPPFCLSFQGQFKDTRPTGPIKITQENVNGRYISYEAQQICEPEDRVLFFAYRDRSALLRLMEKRTIKIRTR